MFSPFCSDVIATEIQAQMGDVKLYLTLTRRSNSSIANEDIYEFNLLIRT